jgi:hypothetical protein
MGYITGKEVVLDLPLEDPPVTAEEAQRIIEDWVGRVQDAGATVETGTSRYIVRLGASAEVLRKALRRSGYVETGEADSDLERADTMLGEVDLGPGGADVQEDVVVVDHFLQYSDDELP